MSIWKGKHCEFWILPHEYSCGGYYVAERWQKATVKGVEYDDNLNFWLLSGNEVLNKSQAMAGPEYRKELGAEVTVVWADSLPEGARWLNLRNRA